MPVTTSTSRKIQMAEAALQLYVTYNNIDCCNCGMTFAVPVAWERERRTNHNGFFCPNGHSLVFNGPSVLEKQVKEKEEEITRLKSRLDWKERSLLSANRSNMALRGQRTKLKNRISNGVCPCCHRTFGKLQSHMETKHPDWQAKEG
jgi:hypothetical protein